MIWKSAWWSSTKMGIKRMSREFLYGIQSAKKSTVMKGIGPFIAHFTIKPADSFLPFYPLEPLTIALQPTPQSHFPKPDTFIFYRTLGNAI